MTVLLSNSDPITNLCLTPGKRSFGYLSYTGGYKHYWSVPSDRQWFSVMCSFPSYQKTKEGKVGGREEKEKKEIKNHFI